jgi:hypothetical protein
LSPKIRGQVGQVDRIVLPAAQPNHPVAQLGDRFTELGRRRIDQPVCGEQPAHSRQSIGTDQQFAGPARPRSRATSNRSERVISVLVRDQLELRPVSAACAALSDTGDELSRKGRIIAAGANGPDLPLKTAKVVQALGVGPRVGLSKAALLLIWHLCTPLWEATLLLLRRDGWWPLL